MIVSKGALVFVTFVIIFSVFVANVSNLISVDRAYDSSSFNLSQFNGKFTKNRTDRTLSDSFDHLIWFLQISDIHVSKFQDKSRITELKEFCDVTVSIIKPSVVLVSGDLTDAKTEDHIGSRQYEEEWKYYNAVLNECKINEKTKWLDIRGNHDNFNVPDINARENFFVNYSMQGKHHKRSYLHQFEKDGEVYSFIAVDACLDPGPRRPFNFVGIVDQDELDKIHKLVQQAHEAGTDHIIWFGHFPTSCLLTPHKGGIRPLYGNVPKSLVYLCGHLHQLGGLVKNMYTLQQDGFLELELGDWKDNRIFRLMAIDHGLVSFIDTKHNDWPLILITNPKHALYVIPNREPIENIAQSTHIRILAFSISEITDVSLKLDDYQWQKCNHVKGPLFTVKWNPELFNSGVHTIQVLVTDEQGRQKLISQPFSLDNTRLSFNILARIALMTSASTVFQCFFGVFVVLCTVPLCLFRYLHKLVKEGKMKKPLIKSNCCQRWIRKFWTLATIDRLFFPIILYPIYLAVGPWSAGYIIESHFGVIFAWGIFVRDAYLPGSFTYAYGFLQLFVFHLPFIFIMANSVDHRVGVVKENPHYKQKWYRKLLFNLPFFLIMGIQVIFAYFFWLAYGTLAFLLGPLRTWTIIFGTVLWWQALHLPEKCSREAVLLWHTKSKIDVTDDESETNFT